MKKLLTFLTLLTLSIGVTWAATVTDVLNYEFTGISGTDYSEWSGKAGSASTAVYAGQSGGQNSSIQIRSKNSNSGIVTTTSGGKVTKVRVDWESHTQTNRVLNIYGKNTAYTAATDLFSNSNQGTLIGTLTYDGQNESSTLIIAGDYTHLGIRSADGAIYLSEIDITWETSGSTVDTYAITCNGDDHGSISAAPNPAAENATVTITPAPQEGYQLSTLTAYKTGDTNTPVSISNNQFAMPGYPVTVDATFEAKPTHSITVNGGTASPSTAYEGQSVTVTPTIPEGKVVDQITTVPSSLTLTASGDGYTFTMPGEAVTITFTYKVAPTYTNVFERITKTSDLETGKRYLIICEDTEQALCNNPTGTAKSAVSANINNHSITLTGTENIGIFNLLSGYKLQYFSNDEYYLYNTNTNDGLKASNNSTATNHNWTITIDEETGNATIKGDGNRFILNYNGSDFRTYTSKTQNNQYYVQLYKEVETIVESSDLFIVGQVNGNDEDPFDPEEGVELTYSQTNGTYSGDFYCKGMNGGYSYLLFSKSIPADFDNDKSNLYGAGGNGNAWVINESDYGNAIPLYATSSDSFRLPAGLYSVSIALSGAGFEWTDASVTFTTREKTMVINGSQYFEDTREVTMTSNLTDIGGKIYYTTDGGNPSDPNSSRQEYTGPITINATTTFKAVAFVGNLYSAVVDKTFTKTPKTPVITPNGGTITEATQVTITCETEGASIYYTLDGSTPTNVVSETNFLYSEPFTIDETTTVKARAYVGNTYSNGIATAEFVYTEPYIPGEGDFVLVDSEDDLKAGREYIIVTADYNWAMGAIDADAKKATASQDFEITIDHSTVTLTENSTVNVMKLVDGIEDTNNKYWNLHQANGLNIYLESKGTGIQEKAHGYGLNGYSDEVLINLTTTTNYAIITPGGRQILYQNGSNGAAGVFGHYANSNADATGYQRIFLYYREGATVPTNEVTLAELCATGVKDKDYIIADKLQAVYAYTKGGNSLLWCKDLGNQSIYPTTIHSGQIDFMRNTAINWDEEHQVHNGQQGEWDQSNWIVLQFTNPTGPNNIDQMLQNAQDKFIKPGTIKGKLVDDENYILKMDLDMIETLTPADEGCDEEPYNENVYCPANFLPDNLNIHGGIENGDGAETSTQNYFFMNPKVQEVCYITYAQWNEAYSCFTVPSTSGIPGAFQVGWVYQDKPGLENGHIYKFHAVVHRVGKQGYGPNNPITTKDDEMPPIYENITVLPVDLDPATSEIITSINTVETGNGEVKSVKYVNVAGMVSDVPFQGVNIVVTEYTDGSRTTTKMLKK